MRSRPLSLAALSALIVALLSLSNVLHAQDTAPRPDRTVFDTERPLLQGDSELTPSYGITTSRTGMTKVVLELTEQPATQVFAAAEGSGLAPQDITAQVQRQLAEIERTQQALATTLQRAPINAQIIYRTQRVYNGIAIQVDAEKLAQIRGLPNVRAIRPLVTKHLDNASSVPLIGGPALWNDAIGNLTNTGEGISIGVIDTGIDYLHTNFGGAGSGYEANDVTTIADDPFPTAKVAGGYDFAGDDYNADPDSEDYQPIPKPDPDPMDCNGHGSHVAGTAAGYGVEADGDTYTGAYSPSTPFDSLRIGPGVAPEASLYALKVFGCDGSTDVTDLALEWAVDPNMDGDFSDHLDVINMSLGSGYGGSNDSTVIASDNAALAGVIVVASAGNSGDTYYVTGSPGTSSRTISVASSVDSLAILDGIRVDSSNNAYDGIYAASNSVSYDFQNNNAVTGQLVYPPTQRTGCQPFSAENAALIAGKIVLLDWSDGECGSVARGKNAREAGAIGFILVDDSEVFDLSIFGDPQIPGVSMPKSEGDRLKAALASGATVTVTLGDASLFNSQRFVDESIVDTLSDFSSRGPRRNDSFLKPDISAPGQTIFSTNALTGDEGLSLSGTSMAAPHIAGSMALMRQLHPDWTVEELKALIMNTATNDVFSQPDQGEPAYGPQRIGTGRVDLPDARDAETIAYIGDQSGLVSVSFGAPEVVGTASATRSVRIVNKGGDSETAYTISYEPVVDMPGVEYTLSRSTLNLDAGGFGEINVTMTANAEEMKRIHDPTVEETQVGLPRFWLTEEAGYLTITPAGGEAIRVPVHAVPRPASNMRAESNILQFTGENSVENTIGLTGEGVLTGSDFPTDTVSVVTAYELQHISPDDPNRPVVRSADLEYVGVASDYAASSSITEDTRIFFGIATHDDWQSPNVVEFNILIDTNKDGTEDYVLFNTSVSSAGDPTDVFVTGLFNVATGSITLQDFLNGVPPNEIDTQAFNTSVMALPVYASGLGLNSGNASFDYQIITFSRDNDIQDDDQTVEDESIVDITPVLSYNIARPGLDTTDEGAGVPAYPDLPNEEVPVRFDAAAYGENNSLGVLLLHHHNVIGLQAEIVVVQGELVNLPNRIYFPLILKNSDGLNSFVALTGTAEVPSITDVGTGSFTYTYNAATRQLNYTLTIQSATSPIVAAHIHRGKAGENGPVAYGLYSGGGTLGPGSPLTGTVTLSESDATLLTSGGLYVNVHSQRYPAGEMRGQLFRP